MAKIQIIIDDEKSLKAVTCVDVEMQRFELDYPAMYGYDFSKNIQKFNFTANNIIVDDSPTLISLPDELLLRIRDYNIDTEHQHAIKQTFELKEKIESLKDQVRGWELRRDLAMEDYERYHKEIIKIIDKYPRVAAEIALKDGNLECACHFAKKANEEE
jgi:hypothetical protein